MKSASLPTCMRRRLSQAICGNASRRASRHRKSNDFPGRQSPVFPSPPLRTPDGFPQAIRGFFPLASGVAGPVCHAIIEGQTLAALRGRG